MTLTDKTFPATNWRIPICGVRINIYTSPFLMWWAALTLALSGPLSRGCCAQSFSSSCLGSVHHINLWWRETGSGNPKVRSNLSATGNNKEQVNQHQINAEQLVMQNHNYLLCGIWNSPTCSYSSSVLPATFHLHFLTFSWVWILEVMSPFLILCLLATFPGVEYFACHTGPNFLYFIHWCMHMYTPYK